MESKKIIMLASSGLPTNIIYHALDKEFGVDQVILEEKESAGVFLKRRLKKLGWIRVIGQILFQLIVVKYLTLISQKRTEEILRINKLDSNAIPFNKIYNVLSVNEEKIIKIINDIDPDLIIVCGTKIISQKVLETLSCRLMNIHAGITPCYRGVHGAYWALVNDDIKNAGVTVHFIDEGIDTGNIIVQGKITIDARDNFTTYPLLQLSKGIELLIQSVDDYFNNTLSFNKAEGQSKLYYHPTIWQYLYYLVVKKIK